MNRPYGAIEKGRDCLAQFYLLGRAGTVYGLRPLITVAVSSKFQRLRLKEDLDIIVRSEDLVA